MHRMPCSALYQLPSATPLSTAASLVTVSLFCSAMAFSVSVPPFTTSCPFWDYALLLWGYLYDPRVGFEAGWGAEAVRAGS